MKITFVPVRVVTYTHHPLSVGDTVSYFYNDRGYDNAKVTAIFNGGKQVIVEDCHAIPVSCIKMINGERLNQND